jgi:hypothetical protein
MTLRGIALAALMVLFAGTAEARITRMRIDRVEPFADGALYGETGAYERVIGTAWGELDPKDPHNAGIVGIDRAPRNAAGRVDYQTDIFLLRPVDPEQGNHHLLFEVVNRGNKYLLHTFNLVPVGPGGIANDPKTAADAGDGLLFRQGYIMAWAGWDPDSPRANHGMTARIPALKGVVREIRDVFVPASRAPAPERFRLSYTAAGTDQPGAQLTVRRREADPPTIVARSGWRFADARTVELLPAGTRPEVGSIYELTYRASNPWVSGVGFAIQRDVVTFLRSRAPDNPARGVVHATFGFGSSQSGRFLRDFIHDGFNQAESGRRVFDGVLSSIAGIGGVFLNAEFAQPFRTRTQHEDHTMPENAFPFSSARLHDPATGARGALLRGDFSDPLLIEANSSAEYWQKGASLLSTDPTGKRDVELPASTRLYLIAGTQHGARAGLTSAPGHCANPRNPHDPSPALRALLVALDDWVSKGTPPPPSRVPRIAEHTLVPPDQLNFPPIPGAAIARAADTIDPPLDRVHPRPRRSPYRALVPAVDADGNERAGLRLPDIAVPLATYTGWNLYKAPFPEGELCDRDGSSFPFARTDAERAAGDPRASLAARYGSLDRYVTLTEAAAAQLVQDRLLLAEDAERYVAAGKSIPAF